jgi:hypothetical protein
MPGRLCFAPTAILQSLRRLEDRLDEFFKTFLDAKFPHGKPTDRWGRGR